MKDKFHQILCKGSCIFVAATFVGNLCVEGKSILEKIDKEKQVEVVSETILEPESTYNEKISYSTKMENNHLKIGAYVNVYGRGNESSDGTGNLGYSWNGEKMMIVGVRKNSKYPYACAIVDSTPSEEDIMAWFKPEDIMPLTKDYSFYKDATKIVKEDGTITYIAPEGYALCNGNSNQCIKITRKYIFSDDSKEEISEKYSLALK